MNQRSSRREFMRMVGAGSAAALSAGALAAGEKPNVLFIAVDDLNDWVGCLGGHPDVKTPNIDRLAKRGVLFTKAYCSAPLCNPSRASLLTGVLPSVSGVYGNDNPWRKAMPDAVTLPQHFRAAGYSVMGAGKIFHGKYNDEASWDEYYRSPGSPAPPKRPVNGIKNTKHFDWGPVDAPDEDMGDWKVVDWAAAKLAARHDGPFFLAAGMFRPHLPWYVPRKYFDMYPPDEITLPKVKEDDLDDVPLLGRQMANPGRDHKNVTESGNWRKAVSGYLASVSFADACVGRLLDALDRSAYAANTVVVLWGDHGWHLGEKLHWRKMALWEEATRNPLLFVAPGLTRSERRCARTVSLMDIYPTLIEVCGLAPKEGLAGKSLVPLLKDPAAAWDRPALSTYGRGNHSVRSERWRYIRYRDGTEELYDHSKDEAEWTNLADSPECAEAKKELAKWLPATDAEDAPLGPRGLRRQRKQRAPASK